MSKRTLKNAAIYTGAFLLFAVVAIAQSKPVSKDDSVKSSDTASATAREASSGMATGRRQYQPLTPRDASSGQASGIVAPHEPASGQASGRKSGSIQAADFKRTTEVATSRQGGAPIIDEVSAQAQTSNQASAASSKSLGSAHATESIDRTPLTGKNELDQLNTPPSDKNAKSTNPMYQDKGTSGTNPLFEQKSKTAAAPTASNHSHETVEYKDPEDQTTRYRPGNNKTTKSSGKTQPAGAQSH